jgi:type IV fimbrial biogenesis protein FimT
VVAARTPSRRSRAGFTIVELAITLAIVAVVVALAIPSLSRLFDGQRLRESAQDVEAAFSYARGEALRTGNLHIVFFNEDTAGNALVVGGNTVDILVIDDGRPGDGTQNCDIDAGEAALSFTLGQGVSFGVATASADAPADSGGGDRATGTTFVDAATNQASWVVFRPEGVPLAFSADCSMGAVGSGAGGVYLNNGARDASVVLSPLGASHAHSWSHSGAWSS